MIQHLPPKGFRMVRYYGIYARPIREKIHTLVAGALKVLVQRVEQVAQFFAQKRGTKPEECRRKLDEPFGKGPMRCPNCGSTKMLLIRIWSKAAGLVYELTSDGLSGRHAVQKPKGEVSLPIGAEQLAFAF